ncbi:MAG TPA: HEAT repeat domain-containing protein, partial [Clostridia bacterium]|nr:HEAT repeat domain-containing protein [Clostridia bacterium]
MNNFMTLISRHCACALVLTATLVSGIAATQSKPAAGPGGTGRELKVELSQPGQATAHGPDLKKQRELLTLIQSDVPKSQKVVACKLLTIHGTAEAVPVLAPLLNDPQMASWARIALEAIPNQASVAALRDAMDKLEGNLLIGVINSLGERRDDKAIPALAKRLEDANPDVASAAAVALGKIGGSSAAKHLQRALSRGPEAIRPALAEGCVRCAENFLADGDDAQARKLYDAVREGRVPRNKMMEATRGAILARGDRGIPMLLEELRATDKDRFSVGLRTARELPGRKATEAIAAEVGLCPEARQPLIFLALADRRDPAALPTVMQAAKTGSKELRLVAVTVLERLGTLGSVPVLVDVATSPDAGLSQAALNALTRLTVDGVEADLVSRLTKSSGREREVLVRVAGQRRLMGGLDQILNSAENPDAGVRAAAFQALGRIATDRQLPGLVRLLASAKDAKDKAGIETALLAISGRVPASVKHM